VLLWNFAAIAVAVLLIALVVNRFAPAKRRNVRRAMAVLALFGIALGASKLLEYFGEEGWARNLAAIADILAAFNVISAVGLLVFDLLLPAMRIELAQIATDLLLGALYVTATLMLLRRAGLDLTGILTTSAVVTGILALSLQATLGNVIGGVALQIDESIRVGDWVQLENGRRGIVSKIGWRHTVLETNDWDTLIVPNATLLGSTFTILGKRDGQRVPHRMWVYFNVDFRYNPVDVINAVEAAVRAAPCEGVVPDPKPTCVCMNFAEQGRDSFGYYAVRYWITDMRIDDPTNSRIRTRIYAALKRAAIPLAVPAAHLWVEQDTDERRARKRLREHDKHLRALRALPFLAPLEDAELDALADELNYVPFAPGEIVTRQGAVAHYLYIIVEGEVEVRVYSGDKFDVVAKVTGPGFVGEMGLMTGQPRMATVVACNDVECYRLDKTAFQRILEGRPTVATEISELLAQRAVELQAARDGLDAETQRDSLSHEKRRLLHDIRKFFALDESE
jgi:small-conductance mechanosensitive channel/CRP-like cAMP-binding protein